MSCSYQAGFQDPQKAIPQGTLLAILITTVIYLGGVIITGSTCARDATGNVTDYVWNGTFAFLHNKACESTNDCAFGLHNYFRVEDHSLI